MARSISGMWTAPRCHAFEIILPPIRSAGSARSRLPSLTYQEPVGRYRAYNQWERGRSFKCNARSTPGGVLILVGAMDSAITY